MKLAVAHPNSGSLSTIPYWDVGFWGGGKLEYMYSVILEWRKTSCSSKGERTTNKLYPHLVLKPGFKPGAHWWGLGKCSHHCAMSLLPHNNILTKFYVVMYWKLMYSFSWLIYSGHLWDFLAYKNLPQFYFQFSMGLGTFLAGGCSDLLFQTQTTACF